MKALVMNVSGNNHKPVGLDLKPGEKQRAVAVNIIKSYKPDLILVQEGKKIFFDEVCIKCKDRVLKYDYVFNEECGILYNTVDWTIEKPKSDLEKLYDGLVHKEKINRTSELKSRFHALILKSKGTNGNFLCITFHGHYKGKVEIKRLEILKDFLFLLRSYLKKTDLPLILGGDFNVEFDATTLQKLIDGEKKKPMVQSKKNQDMPNPVMYTSKLNGSEKFCPKRNNSDLYLVPYNPTGNRANIYDHIIVSSTIDVSKIKAVDVFQKIAKLFPEVSREQFKSILDHDSIFMTFNVEVR